MSLTWVERSEPYFCQMVPEMGTFLRIIPTPRAPKDLAFTGYQNMMTILGFRERISQYDYFSNCVEILHRMSCLAFFQRSRSGAAELTIQSAYRDLQAGRLCADASIGDGTNPCCHKMLLLYCYTFGDIFAIQCHGC